MYLNMINIWVVLDVSGFTSESQVYLFSVYTDARKKYEELKKEYLSMVKMSFGLIEETETSLWISGEIMPGETDKMISIFEQEVD